jgi:hypothetical protein
MVKERKIEIFPSVEAFIISGVSTLYTRPMQVGVRGRGSSPQMVKDVSGFVKVALTARVLPLSSQFTGSM